MKRWRAMVVWGGAVFLLVLGIAAPAWATTVSGRASTVIEWYDDPGGDLAVPAHEYLLLNARDMWGGWSFHGYGRVADDLSNEVTVDSRLYNAYLRNNGHLIKGLDMRLGRQFVSTTAGASVIDGGDFRYRLGGHYTLRALGGIGVSYDDGYGNDDYFFGVEASTDALKNLTVDLSYVLTCDESDVAKEMIGLHADYTPTRWLHLYNETQYSLLYEEITYEAVGASGRWGKNWSGRLEYLFSVPVFSSTSIYSVFAVADYQQVYGEVDYKINPKLRSFLSVTHEMYEDFADADVFDFGIETIGEKTLNYYLAGVVRLDDDGQDLNGVKGHVSYRFTDAFEAGFGANVDVLERRLEVDDTTTSSRIWLDGRYEISKKMNLQAKVERTQSDLWDEYYRGRVRFNVYF